MQRLLAGRPEQLKVTVELKPLTKAMATAVLAAGFAALTGTTGLAMIKVKSATGAAAMVTDTALDVDVG